MADTTTKLFQRLDTAHPDYKTWEDEWIRYRDVIGDALVEKSDYLHRNKFEPEVQYNFRLDMSEIIPESGLAIERLIGALYNQKPRRDLKGQESDLRPFLERSTRKGDSWDATVERIAFQLLSYGTIRALVNVPPAQIGQDEDGNPIPLSRRDEKELNVRPWIMLYTPLSIIDWEHDEDDILSMVRIREKRTVRNRNPDGEKTHLDETKFIEYDRFEVRWWVFRESDKSGDPIQLIDQQVRMHGLGKVPMVVDEIREVKNFVGHSFIRYSSRADIRKFRAESDQVYDTYLHAHPFLVIWTEDELKEVGVGSSTYLKLNPGTQGSNREDARYVEAPTSAFEALQRVIDENRTQIFRQAQVDPMGIIASKNQGGSGIFQASGVSRAWSFGTSEARVLSKIADVMSRIEHEVFDMVLRWGSGDRTLDPHKTIFKGDIQYPEEFDLASTAQLLEERGEIASMVNSPKLIRTLDKRIASSKVGDTTPQMLKEIFDEIENNPLLGTQAGRPQVDRFAMPSGLSLGDESEEGEEDAEGDRSDNGSTATRQRTASAPSR